MCYIQKAEDTFYFQWCVCRCIDCMHLYQNVASYFCAHCINRVSKRIAVQGISFIAVNIETCATFQKQDAASYFLVVCLYVVSKVGCGILFFGCPIVKTSKVGCHILLFDDLFIEHLESRMQHPTFHVMWYSRAPEIVR